MREPFKAHFGSTHRRRGAALIFVLVCLVVLLGFSALTIDVGYIYNVRAELQNAADAMSLAGASALAEGPDQVRARVLEFAQKHAGLARLDIRDEDILLGEWNPDTQQFSPLFGSDEEGADAVRVIARMTTSRGNPLQLFFAPLLGRNSTNVVASATAGNGTGSQWDIVIVQDVTGSFVDEIDEARLADKGLLDCIRNHSPGTGLGVVTFTGYGHQLSAFKNVEDDYNNLSAMIGKINSCGKSGMPKCSGTNIGVGLDKAIELFEASASENRKAIVLVSDGMPEAKIPGHTNQTLADWAVNSADAAAAMDISIFTLFYSGNDGSPGASAFLAGLVRGDGTAHETPDPNAIETELQDICKEALASMLMLVE
jgi:Flp pilus assembly protein TadG